MKGPARTFMVAATAVVGLLVAPSVVSANPGVETFRANECNQCHSIKAHNVDPLPPKEGEEEVKIVDLSTVGAQHDAQWFRGWLERTITKTKVKKSGKKKQIQHKKKFKGSTADLDVLVTFLTGLK